MIDGNDVPIITKREMKAQIAVPSRSTIVLGGLVSTDAPQDAASKIPILGDIPLLGTLFRYDTATDNRTELLVLLTPYVLTTPEEARRETERLHASPRRPRSQVVPRLVGQPAGAADQGAAASPRSAPGGGRSARPAGRQGQTRKVREDRSKPARSPWLCRRKTAQSEPEASASKSRRRSRRAGEQPEPAGERLPAAQPCAPRSSLTSDGATRPSRKPMRPSAVPANRLRSTIRVDPQPDEDGCAPAESRTAECPVRRSRPVRVDLRRVPCDVPGLIGRGLLWQYEPRLMEVTVADECSRIDVASGVPSNDIVFDCPHCDKSLAIDRARRGPDDHMSRLPAGCAGSGHSPRGAAARMREQAAGGGHRRPIPRSGSPP